MVARSTWRRVGVLLWLTLATPALRAEVTTWDGKHRIDRIDAQVVYFVPQDREPLIDWKQRVEYYCRRIERFHEREFQGQSVLKTTIRAEPFRSPRTTAQLRAGDGDFIFFQTLGEVNQELRVVKKRGDAFPVLLVLSEINWRPLDDFYRLQPTADGAKFDGTYSSGRHFPGSPSGGARATYIADQGVGWGLVSADGWRVPYSGSDCVVYHEGVGHAVGLPHPEPGDNSVMSLGQYHGWINESWVDDVQKRRLGWKPPDPKPAPAKDLFSVFKAWPEPAVPRPGQPVSLKAVWPPDTRLKNLRVRVQTDVRGPWTEVLGSGSTEKSDVNRPAPDLLPLGQFDRPTPVSYRIDAVAHNGQDVELWGYFQVRTSEDVAPLPSGLGDDGRRRGEDASPPDATTPPAIDLLALVDVSKDRVHGDWKKDGAHLIAPRDFGARLELPYSPPEEYELTVIAEPLDEPNGLILGQRSGGRRFLTLVSFATGEGAPASALENIDGQNVGANATTVRRSLFVQGRPSQIVCTVKKNSVVVQCDGHELIAWRGDPKQLSLSDYWKTPNDNVLFLGAYDCRYRFSRVTLTPLSGEGNKTR